MREITNVNEFKSTEYKDISTDKDVFDKILAACSRNIKNNNEQEDVLEGIKVFRKYFSKDNPILDINKPIPGQGGWNPLAFTTFFGKLEETKELLALGANPTVDIGNKVNVLHLAATDGRANFCSLFLSNKLNQYKVNINSQCINGRTAMMRACESGHLDVVKILMPFHPDVMLKDKSSKTCLDYGMDSGSFKIVRYIEYYHFQNKIPLSNHEQSIPKKVTKI